MRLRGRREKEKDERDRKVQKDFLNPFWQLSQLRKQHELCLKELPEKRSKTIYIDVLIDIFLRFPKNKVELLFFTFVQRDFFLLIFQSLRGFIFLFIF